ncbi:MAG: hypothetical protein NVS3B1_06100 [Marmoricola sp.]
MTEIRTLTNGRLVEVDERGRATFFRCGWLVQQPTFAEEIDFPEDAYRIVECGALTVAFREGWACDNGHEFGGMEYECSAYGPEWAREQAERGVYA